jgi:DNA primase
MQVLFEQGLYVKIILLPEGKDPDDYFRENPKDIDRLLLESKDAISHYIFEAKNSTEKRGEIIHKIKELLAMIPDNLIRKMYFDELDEKLGQYKGVLAEEIDKMPNNRVIQQQKHSKLFYLEARLLYFLIKNGKLPIHGKEGNATVFGYIKQELQDVFELGYCEELVEIINLIGATTNPNSEYIAANTNNATILEMLSFLYAEAKHNKENTDVLQVESTHIFEYVYKYILQLKFELMNKLIEENAKLLNGENDELVLNTHNAYVQYKHQIQKQINETKLPIQ